MMKQITNEQINQHKDKSEDKLLSPHLSSVFVVHKSFLELYRKTEFQRSP